MENRYSFLVKDSEDRTDKRVGMFTNEELREYVAQGYRIIFTEYMKIGVN